MSHDTSSFDVFDAGGQQPPRSINDLARAALAWSGRLLVAVTWISGAIFAVYILAFFGGAAARGDSERWNDSLPGLHDAAGPLATIAIGAHFVAGGVLLLLGPIQLIGRLRRNFPALHRRLGRVYVLGAALAGGGGLTFIFGRGTVGGPPMDVGFGSYGALMVLCAAMAYVNARTAQYERHRAWAIRLFALTVGSWLYRMEYAAWSLLFGNTGMGKGFSGWFDIAMMFFFYVPNLVVAEFFIRARHPNGNAILNATATALLVAASVFVTLATWMFTTEVWGPKAISVVIGAAG